MGIIARLGMDLQYHPTLPRRDDVGVGQYASEGTYCLDFGDVVAELSGAQIDELASRIDTIRNPWDKPGLVPTEPGPYYTTDGRVVESCTRTDRGWLWHRDGQRDPELMFDQVLDLAQQQGWRFCKRWTPSPPDVQEQCPNSGSPISRGGEWQCSCGARGEVPADMRVPTHAPGRAP